MPSRCTYYLHTRGRPALELDITRDHNPYPDVYLTFWLGVFAQMEQAADLSGLHVHILWILQPDELPEYGDHVVVLLLQDEFRLVAECAGRVRYLFRNYGTGPIWPALGGDARIQAAILIKFGLDTLRWLVSAARVTRKHGLAGALRAWRSSHQLVVPLGYARQKDLAPRAFSEREYLVSFMGSLGPDSVWPAPLRGLLRSPKQIARERMLRAVEQLQRRLPNERCFIGTLQSFGEAVQSDGEAYSRVLAETRICLAPRGSSVETYRFFEGLRYGCVVICDQLPDHWFYQGCPAIQITDWRQLPSVVESLLADPARMLALHRAALDWWQSRCSEQAVGRRMAERLKG